MSPLKSRCTISVTIFFLLLALSCANESSAAQISTREVKSAVGGADTLPAPVDTQTVWDLVPSYTDQRAANEGAAIYDNLYRANINRSDCHRLAQFLAWLGTRHGSPRAGAKALAKWQANTYGGNAGTYAFEIAEDWRECADKYYR